MRLPVDLSTPLPELPRDERTVAAGLANDFKWSYRFAREVIGLSHRRAESRYNEHVVKHTYQPAWLDGTHTTRDARPRDARRAQRANEYEVDSWSFARLALKA